MNLRTESSYLVTTFFGEDHHILDAVLEDIAQLVAGGELVRAAPALAAFRRGLERHMRLEEEVIFPAFEALAGRAGPTSVMRREHQEILASLAQLEQALASDDRAGFRATHRALIEDLSAHNQKEERVIYPLADRALSPEERLDVLARLRRG